MVKLGGGLQHIILITATAPIHRPQNNNVYRRNNYSISSAQQALAHIAIILCRNRRAQFVRKTNVTNLSTLIIWPRPQMSLGRHYQLLQQASAISFASVSSISINSAVEIHPKRMTGTWNYVYYLPTDECMVDERIIQWVVAIRDQLNVAFVTKWHRVRWQWRSNFCYGYSSNLSA